MRHPDYRELWKVVSPILIGLVFFGIFLLVALSAKGSVTGYTYLVSKFTNVEQLTVAALPTPDGTQGIRIVLDGATVEDCATGGGTDVVLCLDTGTWEAVGSGAGGDITAVGDCTTGDCFQTTTARHAFLGPVGGGIASFRAITEADISDLSHTTDTTCLDAGVDCLFASASTEGGVATSSSSLASGATVTDYVDFPEIATPSSPGADTLRLWAEAEDGHSILHWGDDNGSDLEIGRDGVHIVRNATGGTLTRGTVVYITGATGGFLTVGPAQANSATTMPAVGMLLVELANNETGLVLMSGDLEGFDTSAWSEGAELYVSATVAGGLTDTAPTGGDIRQHVATVGVSNVSTGNLVVRVSTEIEPVTSLGSTCTDAQVLGGTAAGTGVECQTDDDNQVATEVPITDSGAFFTGTEVETALQEVGPTMTDARTPTAHASTHGIGQSDPVTITEAQVSDLSHTVDTDEQSATEVPYAPTTPTDWTDPDPTEVGGALDTLASRDLTLDDLSDNSVTDLSDVTAVSGNTTTLGTTSGVLTSGNCVEIDVSGNLIDAGLGCGGVTPSRIEDSDGDTFLDVESSADADFFKFGTQGSASLGYLSFDWTNNGSEDFRIEHPDAGATSLTSFSGGVRRSRIRIDTDSEIEFIINELVFVRVDGPGLDVFDQVKSSVNPSIRFIGDEDTGISQAALNDMRLIAGGASILGASSGRATTYANSVSAPSAATCTSTGDANPGFVVITPTTSFIRATNSDPDGCSVSLSETGATSGQSLEIHNVSNAGGTLDFNDSSGVQETGTGCSLSLWGVVTFRYSGDRWVLSNCIPSN